MEPNPFVARHLESNRQSRHAWARFAPHRARVTGLVTDLLPAGGRLCVAGAGNLNDLDLPAVLAGAGGVDLVDLDGDAMDAGLRRLGLAGDPRIHVHRADLSGLLGVLGHETTADRLVAAVDAHDLPLSAGAFDVVLSVGVITQLFQSVVDAGLDPETTVEVTLRLRERHLGDMTRLARPDGHVVLVTDTVPTTTAPHLLELDPAGLEPALAACVADGNFFTGTNPYRIVAVLEEAGAGDVRLHDPWLWAVTADRHHLTYALTWRPG
jgi:hypothetical protein